jgi:hypothetical protein
VGQGRGGVTLVCHSMLNVAAHEVPRERRPTNGLERTFGLSAAAGVELTSGGGPARGGICLFSRSSLLHCDQLAWRFASILRHACPTLRGVKLTSGGGPARGGIFLFSGSSLLHCDQLAWRFAAILRHACPTLRGVKLTSGGGPARGGIFLFSGSSLLHCDQLAWRFAAILRHACPTLRVGQAAHWGLRSDFTFSRKARETKKAT